MAMSLDMILGKEKKMPEELNTTIFFIFFFAKARVLCSTQWLLVWYYVTLPIATQPNCYVLLTLIQEEKTAQGRLIFFPPVNSSENQFKRI